MILLAGPLLRSGIGDSKNCRGSLGLGFFFCVPCVALIDSLKDLCFFREVFPSGSAHYYACVGWGIRVRSRCPIYAKIHIKNRGQTYEICPLWHDFYSATLCISLISNRKKMLTKSIDL